MEANMPDIISVYRNSESEKIYLDAYDEALKLWPIPYESTYVSTRFGETHVLISGPAEAKPLLLMPGASASSTMWYANALELGAKYRLFAVDTVGDVGRTRMSSVPESRKDLADWAVEIIKNLDIRNPHVLGLSYGGFIAANLAYYHPEMIDRLVMISPAAVFSSLSVKFFIQAFSANIFPFKFRVNGLIKFLSAKGFQGLNNAFEEQLKLAIRHGKPNLGVMPISFSDEELKSMKTPALLMIGDQEVIYKEPDVLRRAGQLWPDIKTELVQNAGHTVSTEQPDFVNQRILKFLEKE